MYWPIISLFYKYLITSKPKNDNQSFCRISSKTLLLLRKWLILSTAFKFCSSRQNLSSEAPDSKKWQYTHDLWYNHWQQKVLVIDLHQKSVDQWRNHSTTKNVLCKVSTKNFLNLPGAANTKHANIFSAHFGPLWGKWNTARVIDSNCKPDQNRWHPELTGKEKHTCTSADCKFNYVQSGDNWPWPDMEIIMYKIGLIIRAK